MATHPACSLNRSDVCVGVVVSSAGAWVDAVSEDGVLVVTAMLSPGTLFLLLGRCWVHSVCLFGILISYSLLNKGVLLLSV